MSRVLPILFNTDMVRAILDGRKTVTRRLVKPQPTYRLTCGQNWEKLLVAAAAPYQPGDILYVRETWFYESHMEDVTAGDPDLPSGRYLHRYIYKADSQGFPDDYIIDHDYTGKTYPRNEQVKRCGNAVCPQIPSALVKANLPELCIAERTKNCVIKQEQTGQLRFA